MANFDVYNGPGEKLADNQPSPFTIEGLEPNKTYSDWKIAYAGSDVKVDFPEFTTKPRLLTSFRVDNTNISGEAGGTATANLSYFTPADATDKSVKVGIEDNTVATITDNGDNTYTLNLLKAGTTKVHWVAKDGGGAKADATVTVTETPGE